MDLVTIRRAVKGARTHGAGFSLVEVLVASFLLVTVLLAIVPLFMRSIINNNAGNDYTQLSNHSKSEVEELFQLDFDNVRFDIPAGQTEAKSDEYWSRADKEWKTGVPTGGAIAPWYRETIVRQYDVSAVDGTATNFDFLTAKRLDGGTAAGSIHLKEIIITVRAGQNMLSPGGSQDALNPGRRIVVRTLKAK